MSGTRLRLAQVAVADSGEYVCRVTLGTVTQEASVIVTVPSSAGTAGSYYRECERDGNSWGQTGATSVTNIPLSLSPPPAASGVSQPLRIESSSSAIAEGQILDLNCVVAGSGPTTVTWYKRGGSLPTGHQVGRRE